MTNEAEQIAETFAELGAGAAEGSEIIVHCIYSQFVNIIDVLIASGGWDVGSVMLTEEYGFSSLLTSPSGAKIRCIIEGLSIAMPSKAEGEVEYVTRTIVTKFGEVRVRVPVDKV